MTVIFNAQRLKKSVRCVIYCFDRNETKMRHVRALIIVKIYI
jgi:hypothetical protein